MAANEFAPVTPGEMIKREFLAEYGLSQNQLAKALGISRLISVSTRTAAAPGCGYENDTRERARPPRKNLTAPVNSALGPRDWQSPPNREPPNQNGKAPAARGCRAALTMAVVSLCGERRSPYNGGHSSGSLAVF
jgi:hypothetical protein